MLEVNARIRIPEDEFHWTFARSGGPGGQNVNKVASKAVLRWNVVASPSLPNDVKARFRALEANRITAEGDLVLTSQRFRDQERNKRDCLDKLRDLVARAAWRPRARKPTRPSRGSRENRLQAKRRRSSVKVARRRPSDE